MILDEWLNKHDIVQLQESAAVSKCKDKNQNPSSNDTIFLYHIVSTQEIF